MVNTPLAKKVSLNSDSVKKKSSHSLLMADRPKKKKSGKINSGKSS